MARYPKQLANLFATRDFHEQFNRFVQEIAESESSNMTSNSNSPFQPAVKIDKRIKCLLWGESGTGKTTLALQFPSPCVIDLERGTEHYGARYKFDVLSATSARDVFQSIEWLLTHNHNFETLVIDPLSVAWDEVQKHWSDIFLSRRPNEKGNKGEFYDLQPRDWMTIKRDWNDFMRKLISLDMHVVVTSRAKKLFNLQGNALPEVAIDCERNTPYVFDLELQLLKIGTTYTSVVKKDRSGKLEGTIPTDYAVIAQAFGGKETVSRPATLIEMATPEQITEILAAVEELKIPELKLCERLEAYGATKTGDKIVDLTKTDAQVILEKLVAAIGARK